MNGTSFLKKPSNFYPTEWSLAWLEAALLVGLGVLAVVLHRAFDLSLGLPGHHGIEWMALLIIGRTTSRYRGAGTLSSIGASCASMLPILHGENPFTPVFYLLPGLVMDIAFHYFPLIAGSIWFQALLGGLAHLTKPVGQLTINLATGWPFGSFRYGILYPFAGHILFGMIGGLIGGLIVLGARRANQKSQS